MPLPFINFSLGKMLWMKVNNRFIHNAHNRCKIAICFIPAKALLMQYEELHHCWSFKHWVTKLQKHVWSIHRIIRKQLCYSKVYVCHMKNSRKYSKDRVDHDSLKSGPTPAKLLVACQQADPLCTYFLSIGEVLLAAESSRGTSLILFHVWCLYPLGHQGGFFAFAAFAWCLWAFRKATIFNNCSFTKWNSLLFRPHVLLLCSTEPLRNIRHVMSPTMARYLFKCRLWVSFLIINACHATCSNFKWRRTTPAVVDIIFACFVLAVLGFT